MSQRVPGSSREIQNDRNGSVRVHSGSGFRFVVPFPWRLHQILDDMERIGDNSIISWQPDGRHFQVHNPSLFMSQIVPKFFKQKSFKSFQRQLHIYGFQRVADFANQGAYYHESFIRGNRKLSLEITRIKAPPRRRNTSKGVQGKKTLPTPNTILQQNVKPLSRDTTEWLISAGVPFSALDPNPVAALGGSKHASSIYDFADAISSIFSDEPSKDNVSTTKSFNEDIAPLAISFDSNNFFDMEVFPETSSHTFTAQTPL